MCGCVGACQSLTAQKPGAPMEGIQLPTPQSLLNSVDPGGVLWPPPLGPPSTPRTSGESGRSPVARSMFVPLIPSTVLLMDLGVGELSTVPISHCSEAWGAGSGGVPAWFGTTPRLCSTTPYTLQAGPESECPSVNVQLSVNRDSKSFQNTTGGPSTSPTNKEASLLSPMRPLQIRGCSQR